MSLFQVPLALITGGSVVAYGWLDSHLPAAMKHAFSTFLETQSLPLLHDHWMSDANEVIHMWVTCLDGKKTCAALCLHSTSPRPVEVPAVPLARGLTFETRKKRVQKGATDVRCCVHGSDQPETVVVWIRASEAVLWDVALNYDTDTGACAVAYYLLQQWGWRSSEFLTHQSCSRLSAKAPTTKPMRVSRGS